jgi:hypothetical protein
MLLGFFQAKQPTKTAALFFYAFFGKQKQVGRICFSN